MARRRLIDLDPAAWLHPKDRLLLTTLQRAPKADRLIDWAMADLTHEVPDPRLGPVAALPDSSRAYEVYREVLQILDAPRRWQLFVYPSWSVNAMVYGGPDPYLLVTDGLLRTGDEVLLRFVLGHEVGHVLADHCQYDWAYRRVVRAGLTAMLFDPLLAGATILVLKGALKRWHQAGELSADRCGLLALQDPAAAQRCLASLCTEPVPDGPFEILGSLFSTHPERRRRMASLEAWVVEGGYGQILSGHYQRRSAGADRPLDATETELLLEARRELQDLGLYELDEDVWQDDTVEETDELTWLIEQAALELDSVAPKARFDER